MVMAGKLAGIYIGARKGERKISVETAELIADHGLKGDSHAGHDSQLQVSLFAVETLRELISEGYRVSPEELRANLFTETVKLDSLEPGARLVVGETVIEIVEARKPCRSITRIDNRLPKRLYKQCGVLGRIVQGGSVKTGDLIEVHFDERQSSLFK